MTKENEREKKTNKHPPNSETQNSDGLEAFMKLEIYEATHGQNVLIRTEPEARLLRVHLALI